jgi:class 3 adenylate cyclase/uncharacterized protein YcbX
MDCTACHHANEPDDRFCSECGAPLPADCAACGAELRPGAKFCSQCGSPSVASTPSAGPVARRSIDEPVALPVEPTPALEGERKTVTVLFADIKGSMDLIEELDPEDARAVVDPALKLMMEAVDHYDGYVAQSTGDGIFALFGAPLAREDHPQRALYAALRMQEGLKRYSDRIRAQGLVPIQVRVGVNTGEVVLRTLQTGDARAEYTPVGHATSLAARMQALAPIGSIAATEAVQRLCEGYFTFKALGPTRVKGVSDLINVFEVTGLGALRTRLQRSVGRGLTRFVGREKEMEALRAASEQARAGHGQIAAAIAEAGTGKSRLFFEFIATARSGWMVLETFSVSHRKASPFLPLIDLLHGYFGLKAGDDNRRRREKLAGRIAVLDRTLEDTLPYLFSLLGMVEDDDPLADMDSVVKQRRTLEAIKRLLLRESLNQPLMVIFEDLHWIDEHTQEFLNLLADAIGTTKLLLLVNYRPDYSHQWNSKTYYTQLRLDPLGQESAAEMLAALLGEDDELAPLKQLIIEKTEGTPFFMEEMVQVLFDDGVLVGEAPVKLTRSLDELVIPATVHAILATRIDRLQPDAKELLQVLAVIGRHIPLLLVRSLTRQSDDELYRLLNDLQLGEFIYEQPAVGDPEYFFKHALTQEVAYNSMLIEQRKSLHERIGSALETIYADSIDDHLAELAHHFGRSGNVDAGVKYVTDAAKQKMDEARREGGGLADILDTGARSAAQTPAGEGLADGVLRQGDDKKGEAAGAVPDAVESLWRYPVKSMAGEELDAVNVTERGLLGDRVYALVDPESNRAAVVRTWGAELLGYRPQFEQEPGINDPAPAMRVTLPGGYSLSTSDSDRDARLSAALGRNLTLMATAPAGLLVELPKGTLAGAMSEVTEVPLGGGAPPGAFFDYGCVHLIATSTIDHLQAAYPEGRFDLRRFRPNIVVRSHGDPFVENSWVGRTLAIGDEVVLRITIPCPRCSTVTLPQEDLPRDPRILRTIAEHNTQDLGDFGRLPCMGVYADVLQPGAIRRGDVIRCLD